MDKDQYDTLLEVAAAFLDPAQSVRTTELGDTMEDVFGKDYLTSAAADPFRQYFKEIQLYEEVLKARKISDPPLEAPVVCDFALKSSVALIITGSPISGRRRYNGHRSTAIVYTPALEHTSPSSYP
jgi:hypothetical protein